VPQEKIIEYVIQFEKSDALCSRTNIILSALQACCYAYDIDLNFDKVYVMREDERYEATSGSSNWLQSRYRF
jgi:hypothetical protein